MNYMKRNLFTKKDVAPTIKKSIKPPTTNNPDYQDNYHDMISNFLSLSPSDKESNTSEFGARQDTSTKASTSKQKSSDQKIDRLNTVSSDEDASCIMAISEGRGHARCEVGIAAINTVSPHLILCQLSDNLWYSGTLTKLNILNVVEILVPNTYILAHSKSNLIKYIQTMYPQVKITPIPRRHFNEALGIELIRKLCAPSHQNIILQITEKFYSLSSAAALLNYLEFIKLTKYVPKTLKMEYQAKYGTMLIDVETSQRLELLNSLCNEKAPKSSLFGILNYCVTSIGKRNLRAKILQPLCDIPLIKSSHSCVRELLDKGETLFKLNGILKQFNRVDKLLNLAVYVPQENNVKAAEIMINQTLMLKSCLENIPKLYEILGETETGPFQNIHKCLEDPRYNYLLEKINSILSNTANCHGSSQYFQRLYAVKPNINDLLDASRKMYSDKVDAINEIIKELGLANRLNFKMTHTISRGFHMQMTLPKNQSAPTFPESFEILSRTGCHAFITTPEITTINYEIKEIIDMIQITSNAVLSKLLMDIRLEIDAIYHLTGFITELDIIQSLTTASKIGNYCEPTISESIKIKNAIHPFLEQNVDRTECVPNNIIAAPEYNFYLITGPNMGGKSIYIKMIAILQIMFQIGCFIPATSAEFRICDKLFSRIGLGDNIENGSSSFDVEMREMEYIIKNITPNSLVIIDELCRSTNPDEGKILAWRICEKLIMMNGISNDGKYYKDSSNDANDETTNNEDTTIHSLLTITSPFIFVTTHFLELTKLNEQYYSVINLHLSAEQKIIDNEVHLNYLHKVESGVTPITRYGLALARNVRFTSDILPRAEEILNEIISNSTASNLDFNNITFNTTHNSIKISEIQKGLYDLTYNISSVLRAEESKANKLIKINELLADFSRVQSSDFINLIQNQTIDEILNMTEANATSKTGSKSLTVDKTRGDENSTTGKTSDLSYHSLKRRIAILEDKETKKLCTDNELHRSETFTIPKQSVAMVGQYKNKVKPEVASTAKQTGTVSNLKECKQPLMATNPGLLQKFVKEYPQPVNHNSSNLRYLTNQSQKIYKSNLPKNHKLDFMNSNTANSLYQKFLERAPITSPQPVSRSLTKRDRCELGNYMNQLCDDADNNFPEICNLSPEIDNDLKYSLDPSQVISLSSTDNRHSINQGSYYNVSELNDSATASTNSSRKGKLSYQTDLYLKQIFQNEMKKHSTYKTSKIKDNRILKKPEYMPTEKKAQNVYEENQIFNFFSTRSRSFSSNTPSSYRPYPNSNLHDFTRNNEPRKSKSVPTSTVTLSLLESQNSRENYVMPSEVMEASSSKAISDKLKGVLSESNRSHLSVADSISSMNSFTPKLGRKQVSFDIDSSNNNTFEMEDSISNFISKRSVLSTTTSFSDIPNSEVGRKPRSLSTSTVTQSPFMVENSDHIVYTNKSYESDNQSVLQLEMNSRNETEITNVDMERDDEPFDLINSPCFDQICPTVHDNELNFDDESISY